MPRKPGASLAVALALVLVSCSGDDPQDVATGVETGPSSPTGATEVTGSATSGATGSIVGTPLTEDGPLEPGTYTFDQFTLPLTFTVGAGWEAFIGVGDENETKLGSLFALFHEDHPAANLAFVQSTRVVDPAKDWDEEGNVVPFPDDLTSWFADHPYHEAEEPFDSTVGVVPARAVDIYVARVPKNGWPSCGGQCVLWFPLSVDQEDGPLSGNDLVFGGALEEYDRQIVVEVDGEVLLVDIGSLKRKAFEAFIPTAEEVLATVQFG